MKGEENNNKKMVGRIGKENKNQKTYFNKEIGKL